MEDAKFQTYLEHITLKMLRVIEVSALIQFTASKPDGTVYATQTFVVLLERHYYSN